ncbi:MAG: hypothetical protein OHK0022_21990 [Roseiflexaceae bacterium]
MPSDQDIRDQLEQLQLHRNNLQLAIKQMQRQGGEAYALPAVQHSIAEARSRIASIKAVLRGWGQEVEDLPDDIRPTDNLSPIVRQSGGDGAKVDQRKGVFADNSTFNGTVIGYLGPDSQTAPDPAPARPQAAQHQADVLLVCVTDGEINAVFTALKPYGQRPIYRRLQGKVYYDLGTIGEARVWLTRTEMGVVATGGALLTTQKAIQTVKPRAIVMVGIAFGTNDQKQRIGDVLVSKQLMLYDLQRRGTVGQEEQIVPRGERTAASAMLLEQFRHGALFWPPEGARTRSRRGSSLA